MNAAGQLCITTAAGQPSTTSCRTAKEQQAAGQQISDCGSVNHHHNATSCWPATPIGCWTVIVAIQRQRQQELQDSSPTHATFPSITRRSRNTITPARTEL